MKIWLAVFSFCLVAVSSTGATLRVPADFATIKSAVLASGEGDEIIIDPGLYHENAITIENPIEMKSAQPGQKVHINGQGLGNVLNIDSDGQLLFQDIVCEEGISGIYCVGYHENSMTLKRCKITQNQAYGIHSMNRDMSELFMDSCEVSNNAELGIFFGTNGRLEMVNCLIAGNADGGLFNIFTEFLCRDTVFSNNSSDVGGGAKIVGSGAHLSNVGFYDNSASEQGGGLYLGGSGEYFLDGCVFSDCSAPVGAQISLQSEFWAPFHATLNCCEFDPSQIGGNVWDLGLVQVTEDGCGVSTQRFSWGSVKGMYR